MLARHYKAAPFQLSMTALDIQKINSGIYFAAAALLIFLAAMLAGRKVQRNLSSAESERQMDRLGRIDQSGDLRPDVVVALDVESTGG